ncbi:uncharacterized protein si:dkey-112e17.1 isoform X2 [Corythoichthys intestinalis]|uniref:uncharacterized protein si:dkey-112e17.1 isoform X2 n=1 Tax=Corythoichthys intestinalis TaxID=161448 RepID=UPI0025A65AD6|nr:uncharacterized protein si:dkey-112e17.1 isoform X2 [Corythoichthys intestinalis]
MNDGSALPTLQVYFDCGAKVDVVDAQGLILSPGFPYNYSSGTHCVWQFFVPVDYQLILEIFDFDVFESHDSSAQQSDISNYEEDDGEDVVTYAPSMLKLDKSSSFNTNQRDYPGNQHSSQDSEEEQVVFHEPSTKIQKAKVSNSAKRSTDGSAGLTSPPTASVFLPEAVLNSDKSINTASSSHLQVDFNPSSIPSMTTATTVALLQSTDTTAASSGTQQSGLDACPHDVLYISDLITFSSRFCGSNRPPSSQLVFGSSQEMVEVIMELITTTHWGRGFALLFHYNNLTKPGGERRNLVSISTKVDSLLAAVSGAAFFTLILTSVLCVIFRPKLCRKRESSCASTSTEVPEAVLNTKAEASELQLMTESQTNQEPVSDQENNKYSPPRTVSATQNTEMDLSSSGLAELDFGPDEVFIISSAPSPNRPSLSQHTQRERFLRHSDTGPSPVADWPPPDSAPPQSDPTTDGSGGCSRPRAWSVRTFQEFLPPLPQLHKKWCSWNSTSPFTKLVDSAPASLQSDNRKVFSDVQLAAKLETSTTSDSSISNASYPLTQPAQRQRRLNSTSNLRRFRFAGPCFGLLSGTADPTKTTGLNRAQSSQAEPNFISSSQCDYESNQVTKRRDFSSDGDHMNVPVFAISEEEDRQPLVSAEHLGQTTVTSIKNDPVLGTLDIKRPAAVTSTLSPQNHRVRLEWKSQGSQVLGGVCPFPSNTATSMTESNAIDDCQLPHSQPTVLCSVTNHV